jgi:hypothetical protein
MSGPEQDAKGWALEMLRRHRAALDVMVHTLESGQASFRLGIDHAAAEGASVAEIAGATGLSEAEVRERVETKRPN